MMRGSRGNSVVVIVVLIAIGVAGYFYIGSERMAELWSTWTGAQDAETEDLEDVENGDTQVSTGKEDLIRIESLDQNDVIESPLTITGEARGYWYFEASFPVKLLDADGNTIPLEPGYIMATGEWMTEEFVPFKGEFTFTAPATDTGTLVFMKDNPSGLPEHDDSLSIPIRFR